MNRFVSLLLVAFSLAAVTLAQPAQAQSPQWIQGRLYLDSNNTATLDDYGCTTLTYKPLGSLILTSDPLAHGGFHDAIGNANGGLIHQEYLWIGQPNPPGTSITSIDNSMIRGTVTDGDGTASSYVDGLSGATGNHGSYSNTYSSGPRLSIFIGNTSTTVIRTHAFGAATADAYAGYATAAANVTFGPPL